MGSTDSASSKNKIAIIGISSILLVAAVVGTVAYGVTIRNTHESPAGSGGQVLASSKAVHAVCQKTNYKETCEKSLAKAKNPNDPKELIQVALQAGIDNVKEVIHNSSALKEADKNPSVAAAFHVCEKVLDLSIHDLERSIEKIGTFDKTKFDEYMGDLKTWLSGAVTFQEDCLDAFDNTTGETGEKMKQLMKTTRELSSNGLVMIDDLSEIFSGSQALGVNSRRLLEDTVHYEDGNMHNVMQDYYQLQQIINTRSLLEDPNDDYYPIDLMPNPNRRKQGVKRGVGKGRGRMQEYYPQESHVRRLLEADRPTLKPNAVVSLDGSGHYRSIQAAVNTAPKKVNQTFLILIKAGVYHESVEIPKYVYNIFFLGEGPTRTKITGSKNNVDGVKTWDTATVGINGDNFIAMDIGFDNSAGASKHQAVAIRVSADKSIFYNCHFDGFQDTLYIDAHRQFFRHCVISGTIDFIFGDASAVFQNCKIVVRKPLDGQFCTVTAQGRKEPTGKGAIVLQNCTIEPERDYFSTKQVAKAYLGRPWKQFSRTMVMQSYIDRFIAPEGWTPWNTTNFALDTLEYGEYQNRGPGANTNRRVRWKGIQHMTPKMALSFTPGSFIEGNQWIPGTGIPYEPGMIRL